MRNKTIILMLIMLSFPAFGNPPPEKFKNPIFNDVLWSSNKRANRDMKISPTRVKELGSDYDSTCRTLVEDEKGVLLSCYPLNSWYDENDRIYEMFYIRYKWDKNCKVWECPFIINNGKINPLGKNTPNAYSSKVYNCADEELYATIYDSSIPYEPMNCIKELKARGWDKYLPGSLPNKK